MSISELLEPSEILEEEVAAFGDDWMLPEGIRVKYSDAYVVARYEDTSGSLIEVTREAMPAVFYCVSYRGFEIGFDSGTDAAQYAAAVAKSLMFGATISKNESGVHEYESGG